MDVRCNVKLGATGTGTGTETDTESSTKIKTLSKYKI